MVSQGKGKYLRGFFMVLSRRLVTRLAVAGAVGTGATLASAFTFNGSDWLINGNAEATAVGNTNATLNPSFGWTVGGWLNNGCTNTTVEVRSYASIWDMSDTNGVDGWNYSGPSAAIRGNNLFVGGGPVSGNSNGWYIQGMYQDEWLYGNADADSRIDKGNVSYDFSGWFGGISPAAWTGTAAWAEAQVHFTGTGVDKWVTIGGINSPFRSTNGAGGSWSNLAYSDATGLIPVGTRRIEVFLDLGHDGNGWGNDTTYNYGAADDVSFKVTQAVPEPATMTALALGLVGILARRRRRN